MRRKTGLAVVGLGAVVLAWPASGGPRPPQSPAAIRLRAATFVPGADGSLAGEPLRRERGSSGVPGTWLIQFQGPVRPEWKASVEAAGARLLEYVPDFAFKARLTPEQVVALRLLPEVAWVGAFKPAWKLSPRLQRGGPHLYTVKLERDARFDRAASAVAAAGTRVVARQGRTLLVVADGAQLDALAREGDVAWVESFVVRNKHNEYAAGQIMGAQVAWNGGYDGSTQTVAVADTGIGGGTAATAHLGIAPGRVAAIFNRPGATNVCFQSIVDDGAVDVDTGHGTHTSGSALSAGDATGRGRGTAPGATLVFQAIENYVNVSPLCQLLGLSSGYYLTGLPADLGQLFLQAYDAGARVHSDSWGADVEGDYTVDSANTDDFLWTHRDMAVTFSAGNAGVDANGDGGVDGWSIGAPATAKNVIAVGASENDRASDYECDAEVYGVCAFQNGQNEVFTYGEAWPFEFPAEPLKSDPSAGNPEQMAAFSSRGPAGDGRIKPDVVAPGTWVLSAFSDLYQEGYDQGANPQTGLYQYDGWGFPTGDKWKYMGGTSMSTPLVAGAAAVVRDYYQKDHAHPASAALVKATLVNSAVDLLDENNDGVNDNAVPIPNFFEGWGRVDLAGATDPSRLFVDEEGGLQTGEVTSFPYQVSAGTPLKVTLAWTDFPGTEAAWKALVNDLDLEVSGPGGAFYRGNVFGLGWSLESGLPDRANNLENVYVQSPAAGEWTVTVRAFNVPDGPQPFALVVSGTVSEGGTVDAPPEVTVTNPADGASVSGSVNVTADASDDVGVVQVEFFVGTVSLGVDTSAPYAVSWDTTTVAGGPHTLRAVATDTADQVSEGSVDVTVVDSPPVATLTSPPAGATVSGTVSLTAAASDDRGVTQVEFFVGAISLGVDTTAPYSLSWDTTAVTNGPYDLRAVATDTGAQTAEDTVGVAVLNVVAVSLHVSDLDARSETIDARRWQAEATTAVRDDTGNPVGGATVRGTWAEPRNGGRVRRTLASCLTGADGTCVVTTTARSRTASVTWEVATVEHGTLAYDASANSDPDGDSDGTRITVSAP